MWNKINNFNRQQNDDTDHLKIKFNSDDDLHFDEPLKMYDVVIHIRSFFEDGGIFYTQIFLEKCLYNLTKNSADKILKV